MTKKIILLSIITILMQPCTYSGALVPGGAGTVSKVIPPIKFSGFGLPGTVATPAVSTPMIKLTPTQIDSFTTDLSRFGGKEYLAEIQMVWETNPELMYSAQQAIQNADQEEIRQNVYQIMDKAKQLASKKIATFNIQNAITHNPQLEKLINQTIPTSLDQTVSTVESMLYDGSPVIRAMYKNTNFYDEVQTPLQDFAKNIKEILTNKTNTPQQAASKLRKEISNLENIKSSTQSLTNSITDKNLNEILSTMVSEFETMHENFNTIADILQKTAPVQTTTATYPELKNFVESISTPTESSSSLQHTVPGEIGNPIPMPTEIKPFFEQQMALVTQDLTQAAKNVVTLKNQFNNLGLLPDEIKNLELERKNIGQNLKAINQLLKEIKTLSDHPNSLNEFKAKQAQLSIVITQISYSLAKLKKEAEHLLPSEQKDILQILLNITKEILAIEADARTTLLVLEEAHEAKEVMAQIKQNLNLGEFVAKTTTDLATVQKTARALLHILSSKADLLKTDKAPASMLAVFESKLATYLTTFEELKAIAKIEDLGALQTKLQEQEKELLTILDSLFSKLAWLPTSTTKNEALDAFRKLKSEFLKNKTSIDNIFAKAASIQKKHTFVIIRKNELEMGMLTIIDKSKALRMSITKTIPTEKLTSEQAEALSKLNQAIRQEFNSLEDIKRSKTSFEVDELTKEYFKRRDQVLEWGRQTALVPIYEETLKDTLKIFGLKLVLGLTATGVVGWLVQPADKEEEKDVLSPTIITDIPEIVITNIDKQPKTTKVKKFPKYDEFKSEYQEVIDLLRKYIK